MAFIDSSPEVHTVTTYGTAQIDNSVYKFGSGSGLFSTGNYISIPDDTFWNIFNSDWTIDFWFRLNERLSSVIFEQYVDDNNYMRCVYTINTLTADTLSFIAHIGGTNRILMTANVSFTTDTWYHIALTASNWE